MKPRVYVETSVVSYLTARTARDNTQSSIAPMNAATDSAPGEGRGADEA